MGITVVDLNGRFAIKRPDSTIGEVAPDTGGGDCRVIECKDTRSYLTAVLRLCRDGSSFQIREGHVRIVQLQRTTILHVKAVPNPLTFFTGTGDHHRHAIQCQLSILGNRKRFISACAAGCEIDLEAFFALDRDIFRDGRIEIGRCHVLEQRDGAAVARYGGQGITKGTGRDRGGSIFRSLVCNLGSPVIGNNLEGGEMAGCPGQDAIRQSRIHVLHLSIIRAVHLDVAFSPVCGIRYRDGHSAIAATVESVFFPDGGGDFVDWVAALFRLVLQLDDHAGGLINLGRLGRHIVPGRVADGQSAHVGFQLDFLHLLILIDGGQGIGTDRNFSCCASSSFPTIVGRHINRNLAGIVGGDAAVAATLGGFTSAVVAIYRGNHIAALILIGRNLRAIGNINYIFVVRILCAGIARSTKFSDIMRECTARNFNGAIPKVLSLLLVHNPA